MDRGTWRATAHGIAKSRIQLSETWASHVALVVKNVTANADGARDAGLIPGSGRSPGEVNGNPFQYFGLGFQNS